MANTQLSVYSLGKANNSFGTLQPNVPDLHVVNTTNTATLTAPSFYQNTMFQQPATYQVSSNGVVGYLRAMNQYVTGPQYPNWWLYSTTLQGIHIIVQPSQSSLTQLPKAP